MSTGGGSERGGSPSQVGETRSRQGSLISAAAQNSAARSGAGTPVLAGTPDVTQGSRRSSVGSNAGTTAGLAKKSSIASLRSAAASAAAAAADVAVAPSASGLGSRKGSVRSQASAHTTQGQGTAAPGTPAAVPVDVASIVSGSRPASQADVAELVESMREEVASAAPAAPEPVPEPEVELTVEEKLARAERELAEAKQKVYSLEQTNASMQRLMASGSGDSKIKLLTADLNKRAEKIKALEGALKKEKHRGDEFEKALKTERSKSNRASRASLNLSAGSTGQDKQVIRELQAKLEAANKTLSEGGAPPSRPTSQHYPQPESTHAVTKLQAMLTEKESEKQMLKNKLDAAQEAIVSSAGAGFENEVKLQQARTALQSILRSQSPQHSASHSPHSMRAMSPAATLANAASASPFRNYASITSAASKPRAYYEPAGSASPLQQYASYASPTASGSQRRDRSPTRQYSSSPRF
eukprot:Rhum_TRINITY_DN14338_c3_g1::Rhum_TRINITY_DN14338_c3_g1_i1::g.81618::m.81618